MAPLLNEHGDFGGDDTGEAQRQEDIARQREEVQNIGNQFLAQLVPGSAEFNELQAAISQRTQGVASPEDEQAIIRDLGQQLVTQQQARIAGGGPATALEARTGLQVGALRESIGGPSALSTLPAGTRPEEADLFRVLRGEEPTTALGRIFRDDITRRTETHPEEADLTRVLRGEEPTTPLGRILRDQVIQRAQMIGGEVGVEDELFRALRGQSTTTPLGASAQRQIGIAAEQPDLAFQQELDLLQDQINRQAAQRGLATSGIPIEQLGRAGVELAVRKAQEREGIRRQREQDVLGLLREAQAGQGQTQARQQMALQNVGTLQQLAQQLGQTSLKNVGTLQQLSQQLRGREIGLEEAITDLASFQERAEPLRELARYLLMRRA